MRFKIITPEREALLVEKLAPRWLGREQYHLIAFADEIADIAYDEAVLLITPLQQFREDIQSPGGAGMVGITDAGNYFGGVGNINDALQNIGNTLSTVGTGNASLNSPVFTGDPQAPTPITADNDTSIATTAFVKNQGYLTTATAATTYAPIASPTFTGDPKAPTPATADNDTSVATTAFVKNQAYAPLASPTFTGDPKAPTPLLTDNDTSIATTAYVKGQNYTANTGTVTSVGMTGSTGLTIGGAPITTAGTITATLSANLQAWSAVTTASKANVAAPALTGNATINGNPIGTANLPINLNTMTNGEMNSMTAGTTLNTGLAAGTVYYAYNNSAGTLTLTQGAGLTLRLAGTATTGSRTITSRGLITIFALTTTEYIVSGDVT